MSYGGSFNFGGFHASASVNPSTGTGSASLGGFGHSVSVSVGAPSCSGLSLGPICLEAD
jgi:hypothetical protein